MCTNTATEAVKRRPTGSAALGKQGVGRRSRISAHQRTPPPPRGEGTAAHVRFLPVAAGCLPALGLRTWRRASPTSPVASFRSGSCPSRPACDGWPVVFGAVQSPSGRMRRFHPETRVPSAGIHSLPFTHMFTEVLSGRSLLPSDLVHSSSPISQTYTLLQMAFTGDGGWFG